MFFRAVLFDDRVALNGASTRCQDRDSKIDTIRLSAMAQISPVFSFEPACIARTARSSTICREGAWFTIVRPLQDRLLQGHPFGPQCWLRREDADTERAAKKTQQENTTREHNKRTQQENTTREHNKRTRMRKLILSMMLSLDGLVARPGRTVPGVGGFRPLTPP